MPMALSQVRRIALATIAALFPFAPCAAPVQSISLLDSSIGAPSGASGDSGAPVLSADGRYVLFASSANNLTFVNGTNISRAPLPSWLNVFFRDRSNRTTKLVSVNASGTGGATADCIPSAISTNGRYALFETSASDLVPGDTNSFSDVFVRDLMAGTTLLVSAATNGLPANGVSRGSVMTPDGRYVAFVSMANNLVADDTNLIADVFVKDLQSGVMMLVSVGAMSTNLATAAGSSEAPDITPDGRYVAFFSTATNLVPSVRTVGDIYVRDLALDLTFWASKDARSALQSVSGTTNAVCYNHVIGADGRFVTYETSRASAFGSITTGIILRYDQNSDLTGIVHTNASVSSTPSWQDIRNLDMSPDGRFIAFVANTNGTSGATRGIQFWDAQTGTMTLVSEDLSHSVATNTICDWPTIDPSGRFVVFLSSATNMVTHSVIGAFHLYARDLQTATTVLVDLDTNGVGSLVTPATVPRLSDDGRFVAFEAPDGNLVPTDNNHDYDVFVRDLIAGTNELISIRDAALPATTPNGPSTISVFSVSADAERIAFDSAADNLVANDTNRHRDVFVRDLAGNTNLLVSTDTNGVAGGNGVSTHPVLDATGRFAAFDSSAANLLSGDTNNARDVFLRDLQTGTTTLVSLNTAGTGSGNDASFLPLISVGATNVLFHSLASNIATGSFSGGKENLFFRNLESSTTYALTVGGVVSAAMTPDGRVVAFIGAIGTSSVTNLYIWDAQPFARVYTNIAPGLAIVAISSDGTRIAYGNATQLFVADWQGNTNWLVGPMVPGIRAGVRFSGNGRFLAYASTNAQVGVDTNATYDVYLYDVVDRTKLLVSQNFYAAGAANAASDSPDISPDGRFVAYRSFAGDIIPANSNSIAAIYVYDRLTDSTTLVSANGFGNTKADNPSANPIFSADGQTLIFQSWASDLVAGDFNHSGDLFVVRIFSSGLIPLFSITIIRGEPPGSVWLTWPAVPGKSYRAQFKNNFNDAMWQDHGGHVIIVGNQGFLNDLGGGSPQRFYRVIGF
jgi:Tol biopolymer transport system component